MCYVFIYNKGSKFDYAFLLILCLGVALTFSQCTIEILLYEKGKHIFSFLGKYSLCLYLTHFPFSTNLDYVWPADWSILKKMMVYLIICSIAALMVLKISALIRKKIEPIKNILCLVLSSLKVYHIQSLVITGIMPISQSPLSGPLRIVSSSWI